jgi:ubiquinone/menaquinone biosynthesis C-methylase UbiE
MLSSSDFTGTLPRSKDSTHTKLLGQEKPISVAFLNTCYDAFIDSHYRNNPALLSANYEQQLQAINRTFFGDSDFYSRGLIASGLQATDLVVNCGQIQNCWAAAHGTSQTGFDLVARQIQHIRPNVIYVQDMAGTPPELLSFCKNLGILVVGQIACAISPNIRFELYDIIFSSFPHFVDAFREHGLTAYYQPLAFDARILEALPHTPYDNRDIPCSFIGGISGFHQNGGALLEELAQKTSIKIWGYGIENVPSDSAVAARHQGEAWGQNMFSLLGRSRITINRHSEAAGNNANNMRLFEATGCGALLITDYKDNLSELFDIGKEIVAYRSPDECVALINHYSRYPKEAEKIARAGQKRTLQEHSYMNRMQKTGEIITRHVSYRQIETTPPEYATISCNFKNIDQSSTNDHLLEGWKQKSVATSQRNLVQNELLSMYRGHIPDPFSAASNLLKNSIESNSTILEIGCSSGYYYEVLEYLLKKPLMYTGVDYSEHMIEMAQAFYPRANFQVADGANLPFPTKHFDIVISGCVLLHCPNYIAHIKETCRTAKDTILLHRTPITANNTTTTQQKSAYGVETIEVWFSEGELLELFKKEGFVAVARESLGSCPTKGMAEISHLLKREDA